MVGRSVLLDFSAALGRVSDCGLLYKLRSISVRGLFLSLVSEFLSDRKQRMRLDGKASASVDVASGVEQSRVLGQLLILYTSDLIHIVNHIVGADDFTIHAVIPKPLSRPQVMKSVNHNLAAINSWCLKWRMRLNTKKTKFMVVRQSLTSTTGYGDLTLGGAELEAIKRLHILGVTLN